MGGGGEMGSQRKKIIQEMFEVSAKYLYRGGGYQKSLLCGRQGHFLELHIALD